MHGVLTPTQHSLLNLKTQITQDEVEKLVTVSVNTVEDTDKGSYHCQLDYSTDESPLEITSDTSSDLDVYFPPTSLNMSSKMLEDGTIGHGARYM